MRIRRLRRRRRRRCMPRRPPSPSGTRTGARARSADEGRSECREIAKQEGLVALGSQPVRQRARICGAPIWARSSGGYANRLAEGRFELDCASYQLARNEGRHHLHGGVRGFDKRVWTAEFQHLHDRAEVTFSRRSPADEEGYPGTLDVAVTYWLQESFGGDDRNTGTSVSPPATRLRTTSWRSAPMPSSKSMPTRSPHRPAVAGGRHSLRLPHRAEDRRQNRTICRRNCSTAVATTRPGCCRRRPTRRRPSRSGIRCPDATWRFAPPSQASRYVPPIRSRLRRAPDGAALAGAVCLGTQARLPTRRRIPAFRQPSCRGRSSDPPRRGGSVGVKD
jgi:hypothetical protein